MYLLDHEWRYGYSIVINDVILIVAEVKTKFSSVKGMTTRTLQSVTWTVTELRHLETTLTTLVSITMLVITVTRPRPTTTTTTPTTTTIIILAIIAMTDTNTVGSTPVPCTLPTPSSRPSFKKDTAKHGRSPLIIISWVFLCTLFAQ